MTSFEFLPRRRGSRAGVMLLAGLLALVALACGGDDEGLAPGVRTPETGDYDYDAIIQIDDSVADTLSGMVAITVSSEDSIVGIWTVPGYDGTPQRGPWHINAYALPAPPTGGPPGRSITHRIWRQQASPELNCEVSYQRISTSMPPDTFISSTFDNDCSLRSQP